MRTGDLKTVKEIAREIGRGEWYVRAAKSAMEAAGVPWTANMIALDGFLTWVRATGFRSTHYARRKTANHTESHVLTD